MSCKTVVVVPWPGVEPVVLEPVPDVVPPLLVVPPPVVFLPLAAASGPGDRLPSLNPPSKMGAAAAWPSPTTDAMSRPTPGGRTSAPIVGATIKLQSPALACDPNGS